MILSPQTFAPNTQPYSSRTSFQVQDLQFVSIPDVGFCNYHHGRDKQTTIYEIAILKEYQRQGYGRLLFYRVLCSAIERGYDRIVAKCPVDLESNGFYVRLGFKLVEIETGRATCQLNRWQYDIQLPLLFYCADGGRNRYSAIADEEGWRLGLRSDEKLGTAHCAMVDNHWIGYNHAQHLAMVKRHKPLIATARDVERPEQLPEILQQARELAQFCGRVLLIPKCAVPLERRYWLGFSVPSSYAGIDPGLLRYWLGLPTGKYAGASDPAWYGNHFVHLLGGSPNTQAHYARHLNVVSLDGNYAMLCAKYGKSVWQGVEEKIVPGCYESFRLSLAKQRAYWHRTWSWKDEPLFSSTTNLEVQP